MCVTCLPCNSLVFISLINSNSHLKATFNLFLSQRVVFGDLFDRTQLSKFTSKIFSKLCQFEFRCLLNSNSANQFTIVLSTSFQITFKLISNFRKENQIIFLFVTFNCSKCPPATHNPVCQSTRPCARSPDS